MLITQAGSRLVSPSAMRRLILSPAWYICSSTFIVDVDVDVAVDIVTALS
jgi:hypothetical protein